MATKAYISNIAPAWPVERQEKLLSCEVEGWDDVSVYRDILLPRRLRARDPAHLEERRQMLRPTGRPRMDIIYVATLAVLAWRSTDFEDVLRAAEARRATIVAINTGKRIALDAPREEAIEAFRLARANVQREAAAKSGAVISKEKRRAASDAKIGLIRELWPKPSKEWSTATLLAMAGLSRNTVQERLGKRPIAQYLHQRALKRRKVKNDEQV